MSGILDAVNFREFWSEDQIKRLVARYLERRRAAFYDSNRPVDADSMRSLCIFSTSKQQTWLIADSFSLRWVLDDRRKEEPRVEWEMRKADVEPIRADYDYSQTSGALYFGDRPQEWLFSKHLFQTVNLVDAIRQLLADAR